jgi:hypothetical protein
MNKASERWMSDKTLEEEQSPRPMFVVQYTIMAYFVKEKPWYSLGKFGRRRGEYGRRTGTLGQWQ